VDCDLKSYFDTIRHDRLMALVRERIVDGNVLALIQQSLKAGVLEELKGWQPTERGTPQGAVISPLLANLYLNPLDHEMAHRGWEMVRYADDFVVLCRTREEADAVLAFLREWTVAAGLTLHPTKTRTVNAQDEGFDFLGWHFRGRKKWPRKKSLQKLQEKLRPLTKRANGRSLSDIVAKVNPILRGWYGYFRESHPNGLRGPDGWLRRRLRAGAGDAAAPIWLGWGNGGRRLGQDARVLELLRPHQPRLVCLGLTAAGAPLHPLYQPAASLLRPYGPSCGRSAAAAAPWPAPPAATPSTCS
jgi:RNA-directed DNA polymerase